MALLTQLLTQKSITGLQTTGGAPEETLNLSVDGALAAASIAVPLGTILAITDIIPSGAAASRFRIQQSNDGGVGWFDVLVSIIAAAACPSVNLNAPIKIIGSATTLIRARVETPGGAALVSLTLRAAQQS